MIESNIRALQQGIDLLTRIEPGQFTRPEPRVGSGGIGPQLRHCLDFYACFLRGLGAGRVDYDSRDRDLRIETDRDFAIERMRDLADTLGRLTEDGARRLEVKMDSDGDPDGPWSQSTVARELQFLLSHTVHHYAIIGTVLRLNGIDPGDEFGYAPSTLAYQQSS